MANYSLLRILADHLLRRFSWNEGFHPRECPRPCGGYRLCRNVMEDSPIKPSIPNGPNSSVVSRAWINLGPSTRQVFLQHSLSLSMLSFGVLLPLPSAALSPSPFATLRISRCRSSRKNHFCPAKALIGTYIRSTSHGSLGMPRRPRSQSRLSRLAAVCTGTSECLSIRQGLARDAVEFQLLRIRFVFDFN